MLSLSSQAAGLEEMGRAGGVLTTGVTIQEPNLLPDPGSRGLQLRPWRREGPFKKKVTQFPDRGQPPAPHSAPCGLLCSLPRLPKCLQGADGVHLRQRSLLFDKRSTLDKYFQAEI